MRYLTSYGVALIVVLGLAAWMASGVIVQGGLGPDKGERPVIAAAHTDSETGAAPEAHASAEGGVDPHKTIAERSAENTGTGAPARSVRIALFDAKLMPLEVPLRGRTKANSKVSVSAETSGVVTEVSVTKGQKVNAGDLLCTLDRGTREAAVAQAKAGLAQAQTAFDSNSALRQKGFAATNSAETAKTSLEAAKAALSNAEAELDRTVIRAKVGGIVEDPVTQVGAMLSPGMPCATVVQLDPMLFIASVPEAKVGYARLGLEADIKTVTGETAKGKVTFIASTADEATRTFPIEIEIANADRKLRDGITAEATINIGTAPVHVLPQSVLTLNDEGVLGIRTVEDGNKVAFHAIEILKDTREGVWVVGLPAKMNVITVGQEFVQAGQIVDAKTVDGGQAS